MSVGGESARARRTAHRRGRAASICRPVATCYQNWSAAISNFWTPVESDRGIWSCGLPWLVDHPVEAGQSTHLVTF